MKVSDLIEILEDMDPNANVLLMSQKNYPFEYAVDNVVVREEFDESEGGLPGNDVFLLEGSQLRYGKKAAWDV